MGGKGGQEDSLQITRTLPGAGAFDIITEPREALRGCGESIAGEGMSLWGLTAVWLVPYCPCGDVMLSIGRTFLLPLSP